jgi:hypothetical protein
MQANQRPVTTVCRDYESPKERFLVMLALVDTYSIDVITHKEMASPQHERAEDCSQTSVFVARDLLRSILPSTFPLTAIQP